MPEGEPVEADPKAARRRWSWALQTRREKAGSIDGLNLFFGALLGANLGTLGALELSDYVALIAILAGAVMTLRVFSTSERRGFAWGTLAVYVALVIYHLYFSELRPEGLGAGDVDRLAATLGVWIAAIVITEATPTSDRSTP